MRIILCVLGATIVTSAFARPADAAPIYRYCAHYEERGDVTCAYDTFEQCLATAQGPAGGTCSENPAWRPEFAPVRPKAKRKSN
jgi:uncharacterized protein DUF3551